MLHFCRYVFQFPWCNFAVTFIESTYYAQPHRCVRMFFLFKWNQFEPSPTIFCFLFKVRIKAVWFLYWAKSIRCKLNFNFQSRLCEHVVNDGLIMILYSKRVRRAMQSLCRHFNYVMLYIKYICHISGISKKKKMN